MLEGRIAIHRDQNKLTGILRNSARTNAQICTCEEKPCHKTQSGDWLPGEYLCRKIPEILGNIRLRMNQQCALPAKKAQNILGCTNKSTSSQFRKVIMHFYSTLIALHLQYCDLLCPALPSEAKTLIKWREFSRGSPTGIQHSPYEEELREQDWLRLQKEQLWEHLTESPLQPPPAGHFGEVAKGNGDNGIRKGWDWI